jgi:hypothetical protein
MPEPIEGRGTSRCNGCPGAEYCDNPDCAVYTPMHDDPAEEAAFVAARRAELETPDVV